MKRILLLLIFLAFCVHPVKRSIPIKSAQIKNIAWDLDGVLLGPAEVWRTLLTHPIKVMQGLPAAVRMLWKHRASKSALWEAYIDAAQSKKNPALKELICAIGNSRKLDPEMVTIIRELHTRGYQQFLLSNTGHPLQCALIKTGQVVRVDRKNLLPNADIGVGIALQ